MRIIIQCIENNTNVFIEKPVGNKKDLDKLVKLVKKKSSFVGYMMRFHPAVSKIKEILRKKEIGEIFHFSSYWENIYLTGTKMRILEKVMLQIDQWRWSITNVKS